MTTEKGFYGLVTRAHAFMISNLPLAHIYPVRKMLAPPHPTHTMLVIHALLIDYETLGKESHPEK